jgi:hypothetical protein
MIATHAQRIAPNRRWIPKPHTQELVPSLQTNFTSSTADLDCTVKIKKDGKAEKCAIRHSAFGTPLCKADAACRGAATKPPSKPSPKLRGAFTKTKPAPHYRNTPHTPHTTDERL